MFVRRIVAETVTERRGISYLHIHMVVTVHLNVKLRFDVGSEKRSWWGQALQTEAKNGAGCIYCMFSHVQVCI